MANWLSDQRAAISYSHGFGQSRVILKLGNARLIDTVLIEQDETGALHLMNHAPRPGRLLPAGIGAPGLQRVCFLERVRPALL